MKKACEKTKHPADEGICVVRRDDDSSDGNTEHCWHFRRDNAHSACCWCNKTSVRLLEEHVEVSNYDLWIMLLSTIRYSMGRMSTAPSNALDLYRRYSPRLLSQQRRQILEEVLLELRLAKNHGDGHLGMSCDHAVWVELCAYIRLQEQLSDDTTSPD